MKEEGILLTKNSTVHIFAANDTSVWSIHGISGN